MNKVVFAAMVLCMFIGSSYASVETSGVDRTDTSSIVDSVYRESKNKEFDSLSFSFL